MRFQWLRNIMFNYLISKFPRPTIITVTKRETTFQNMASQLTNFWQFLTNVFAIPDDEKEDIFKPRETLEGKIEARLEGIILDPKYKDSKKISEGDWKFNDYYKCVPSYNPVLTNICHDMRALGPVSYTHLDVYKRQHMYISLFCAFVGTLSHHSHLR